MGEGGGGFDPLTTDWFNPPSKHVDAPAPKRAPARLLPEVDRLFDVQERLQKAISLFPDGDKKDHHQQSLEDAVGNAYRLINRYLRDFAGTGSPGAGTIQ